PVCGVCDGTRRDDAAGRVGSDVTCSEDGCGSVPGTGAPSSRAGRRAGSDGPDDGCAVLGTVAEPLRSPAFPVGLGVAPADGRPSAAVESRAPVIAPIPTASPPARTTTSAAGSIRPMSVTGRSPRRRTAAVSARAILLCGRPPRGWCGVLYTVFSLD